MRPQAAYLVTLQKPLTQRTASASCHVLLGPSAYKLVAENRWDVFDTN